MTNKKNKIYDNDALSIGYDDDNENYGAFKEFLEEHTERTKMKTAFQIDEMGDDLVKEIENKKKREKEKISKLIPYIIKHCDGKYDENTLIRYSLNDVKEIYDEYKKKNRHPIIKLIHFLFNY